MCVPALLAAIPGLGTAGAGAAAGAAAGAGSLASLGTILSIGASLVGGVQAMSTAKANARAIGDQKRLEAEATAVEDQRTRRAMRSEIRKQSAELAARGIQLDSPTAVLLGQTAAKELSFASQSVRQKGTARQVELTSAQRQTRAQGVQGLLRGITTSADTFLGAAPTLWPSLVK